MLPTDRPSARVGRHRALHWPRRVAATPTVRLWARAGGTLIRSVPWILVAAVLVTALLSTGTPAAATGRYAAYWSLCLVLPGTLCHRALHGTRGNLPEDLACGAVTGLLLEMLAWVAASATGMQSWLPYWPAAVVLPFLVVPALRRHWRIRAPRPLPLSWSWLLAAVCVGSIVWAWSNWSTMPLPPVSFDYYQDLLYHLSLVQELTHTLPFQVPQLAGVTLHYHFLSDAHMAAASMITGVDPATVLLRLWLGPVLVVTAIAVAALARDVTGAWWTGPVAAGAALLARPLMLGGPSEADGSHATSVLSPSMTFLLPLLMLATSICVDLVRGRALGRSWYLLPPLAVACAGAKASGLPVLAAGMAVAAVVVATRTRRPPWPVLAGLGTLLAAMLVGGALFVGGGAGGLGLQVLSPLPWTAAYRHTLAGPSTLVTDGLAPPGLRGAGAGAWLFALALAGWWLLLQLPRFLGLAALLRRRVRIDPAAWLLGGGLVAGTGAMWLLFHPSDSQVYFFLPTVPFAAVLVAWLLADCLPGRHAPGVVTVAATFGFVGATVVWAATGHDAPGHDTGAWLWALGAPLLCAALLGAAAAAGWWMTRRSVRWLRGRGAATAVAAVFGAALAANLPPVADTLTGRAVAGHRLTATARDPYVVRAAEIRAARWLDNAASPEDVVATNVHCQPVRTRAHCDSRSFWVTGFGGHRTVVESWGYTDPVLAEQGRDGYGYLRQPAPDQDRLTLNDRVFDHPTAAAVARLQRRYGARWLLADRRAGPVSPHLSRFATLVHTDGPVRIYRLPGRS